MSRRLPVYLLLDTSGSMRGEPIAAVNEGLSNLIASLRRDPYALENAWISIITYDQEVNVVLPLTPVESVQVPEIHTPESGPTHLGRALQTLCKCADQEVRRSTESEKGDWGPILFIMTDGSPSDLALYREWTPEVKKRRFARIIGCAAGHKAKQDHLRELCDPVVSLDTMDASSFSSFFQWVSASVATGSTSVGAGIGAPPLPPPPPALNLLDC